MKEELEKLLKLYIEEYNEHESSSYWDSDDDDDWKRRAGKYRQLEAVIDDLKIILNK